MLAKSPHLALALSGAALLALAGCDKPKSRNPNDQGGPLGVSGATSNPGAAQPAAAGAPAAPAKPTATTDPLPDLPKWAADDLGKPLKDLFADNTADCVGNTDLVAMRYQGPFSPGARIEGWGWDAKAKKPVARILLTDDAGKIVGAGETGLPRPDVATARKEITSPTTGWQAVTAQTAGGLYAWGLTGAKTACRLGHINL